MKNATEKDRLRKYCKEMADKAYQAALDAALKKETDKLIDDAYTMRFGRGYNEA